jgi:hypothetical protein
MDSLPERRRAAVQLAQLEHERIEQVHDQSLRTPSPPEATRGLTDQNAGARQRLLRFDRSAIHRTNIAAFEVLELRDERRRDVTRELAREMPCPNARPGHSFADDVGRGHDDRERRVSHRLLLQCRPSRLMVPERHFNSTRPFAGTSTATVR